MNDVSLQNRNCQFVREYVLLKQFRFFLPTHFKVIKESIKSITTVFGRSNEFLLLSKNTDEVEIFSAVFISI